MKVIARLFTFVFLATALAFMNVFDFDSGKVFYLVVVPFIALGLIYEFKDPITKHPFEDGEIKTDIVSTLVVAAFTALQNYVIHAYFHRISAGGLGMGAWLPESLRLNALPFWLECAVAFLIYDFLFYVTHRLAHTNGFLWTLHSVHHSPNKMNYLNSNRIHPLDMVFRRFLPMVVVLAFGTSLEAFVFVGVVINVIGPITHFNIGLKHGFFNYLVGTNEVHIWHHSAKEAEAKNYGITMIWDHLFGTFYFPKDRRVPDRMGLSDPEGYPIHDYWKQLLLSWKWRR